MAPRVETVDVVVVGGGIAGASSLYHLARSGVSAVLVEREAELGTHSTGRSAATLAPGYGGARNDELTEGSMPFLRTDGHGLADHPLLTPRALLWIHPVDAHGPTADLPGAAPIGIEEAVAVCPTLRPETVHRAALRADGADIDVEELLRTFVRGARQHGAVIRDGVGPVRLERRRDHWTVRTDAGVVVCARSVVNAAGAWADEVARSAGLAAAGLQPLKRTAFVAPVPVDTTGMPLLLAADSSFYVKPDVPGVVLGSRADETPMAPCDPGAEEIDVAYAIDRINAHTTLGIRSVRRAWAGLRVFAPDRNPLVGPHRDDPGFVWCAGLGGTGVQTSPAVGARVAELVAASLS